MNYRHISIKMVTILFIEASFFTVAPYLAQVLGAHAYELIATISAGIAVAIAVVICYDRVVIAPQKEEEISRIKEDLRVCMEITEQHTQTIARQNKVSKAHVKKP